MLRKVIGLLPLVLLCGFGQAGVSMADGGECIARLPQGTVELVGITYWPPTNRSQWWRPDGSAAKIGPFHSRETGRMPKLVRDLYPDMKVFTFLVRFQSAASIPSPSSSSPGDIINLPADASIPRPRLPTRSDKDPADEGIWSAFAINPSGSWHVSDIRQIGPNCTGKYLRIGAYTPFCGATDIVDVNGKDVPHYHAYWASISESGQTTDLLVGDDMGPWETVISRRPDRAGRRTFSRDGQQLTVTFQKATVGPSAHTTQVKLTIPSPSILTCGVISATGSVSGKLAMQLVAVASDGSEHATWILNGRAVFYDLPLSSITELRFQVRPYCWVLFKNVSLHSGQNTNVQIVSPDDSAKTEK